MLDEDDGARVSIRDALVASSAVEEGQDRADEDATTNALGLVHLGIDLKCESLSRPPDDATVIEVNASPLLSQIYRMGYRDKAIECQSKILELLLTQAEAPAHARRPRNRRDEEAR